MKPQYPCVLLWDAAYGLFTRLSWATAYGEAAGRSSGQQVGVDLFVI